MSETNKFGNVIPSYGDTREYVYPGDWVIVVAHDERFDNELLIPDHLRAGCTIGASGMVSRLAHGGDVAVIYQTDRDGAEVAYTLDEIAPMRRIEDVDF